MGPGVHCYCSEAKVCYEAVSKTKLQMSSPYPMICPILSQLEPRSATPPHWAPNTPLSLHRTSLCCKQIISASAAKLCQQNIPLAFESSGPQTKQR